MRVIAGSARGRKLKTVPGDSTRPITDRVKENLFNILGASVIETRWLDLFAGTGQVGIEALSRGAQKVVFLDTARAAIRTTEENLKHCRMEEQADLIRVDAFEYLRKASPGRYHFIYVAPPQYKELWSKALAIIDERADPLLADDGEVIAQIHPKEFRALDLVNLSLVQKREYGSTMLCFYEKSADQGESEAATDID